MRAELALGWRTVGDLDVRIDCIIRRNWSTVADGELRSGERVFIKQFRDARGDWRKGDLPNEVDGVAQLATLPLDCVDVVVPIAQSEPDHTVVYPWLDMTTLDVALRTNPDLVPAMVSALAAVVPQLLTELQAAAPLTEARVRSRKWATGPATVCPKGLDLRNLGWTSDRARVIFFDCGPVQIAPLEEATAKIITSALLMNFGHPVRRMLSGVDTDLTDALVEPVIGLTSVAAMEYELARLWRHRTDEPKASQRRERLLVRPATAILGRRYWADMNRWVRSHAPAMPTPDLYRGT